MKFALIGHPVAGSLSPRLIAAAYDGRHSYDLLDFEQFEDAWKAFVEGYDGINVTAPFKQDAYAKVDVRSPQAKATGAVNLVVRRPEGFVGYNTDVDGVLLALRETGLGGCAACPSKVGRRPSRRLPPLPGLRRLVP